MVCPPEPGQVVDVHFQQGGRQAAYIALRAYNAANQPPPAPSGEFWLVHKTGTYLKFTNDGKVSMHSGTEIDIGNIGGTLHKIVTDAFVNLFNTHTHGGSVVPDQQMGSAHLTSILKAN
jgi:hypothetical protein